MQGPECGMRSEAAQRARGVTLLELMVVITLIAVAGGLVFPSVSAGLDRLRLKSAAERLAATLRYAREHALHRQTVCQVTVDPERRVVEFEELGGDGGRRRSWELPPEIAVRAERPRALLFSPDGGVPRLHLELVGARGRTATIEFDFLTALPQVRIQ